MTSRNGQCPLARINHHLPRLTLWLFVAVAAAIVLATTLGSQAAHASRVYEVADWNVVQYELDGEEIAELKSFDLAPGTLCQEELVPVARSQGKTWFDVYACFPGLYECAAQAGGLGWVAVVTVLRYDGTWCEVRQVAR